MMDALRIEIPFEKQEFIETQKIKSDLLWKDVTLKIWIMLMATVILMTLGWIMCMNLPMNRYAIGMLKSTDLKWNIFQSYRIYKGFLVLFVGESLVDLLMFREADTAKEKDDYHKIETFVKTKLTSKKR